MDADSPSSKSTPFWTATLRYFDRISGRRLRSYAYTYYINQPLAWFITAPAAAAGLSANAVSAASFAVHLAGIGVFVATAGTVAGAVFAYVLLALAYILDSSDGQIAFLTSTQSAAGEWLDHTLDHIKTVSLHAAVVVVVVRVGMPTWLLLVAALALIAHTTIFVGHVLYEKVRKPEATGSVHAGPKEVIVQLAMFPTDWGVVIVAVLFSPWQTPFTLFYGAIGSWLAVMAIFKCGRWFALLRS